MANSRDIFMSDQHAAQNKVLQLFLEQLNAAVRDGQHDAILTVEGDRRVGRARFVQDVFTGAALTLFVAISTLQNKNFFRTNMPMRGITAAGLHAN